MIFVVILDFLYYDANKHVEFINVDKNGVKEATVCRSLPLIDLRKNLVLYSLVEG